CDRLAAWGGDRPVRLLDAGAEVGLLSIALARRFPGWTIDAVDVNDEMLALGRAWAAAEGLERIEFRHVDVTRDLPVDAYDAVARAACGPSRARRRGLARAARARVRPCARPLSRGGQEMTRWPLLAPPAAPGTRPGSRPTMSVVIAAYQAAALVPDAVRSALE